MQLYNSQFLSASGNNFGFAPGYDSWRNSMFRKIYNTIAILDIKRFHYFAMRAHINPPVR